MKVEKRKAAGEPERSEYATFRVAGKQRKD